VVAFRLDCFLKGQAPNEATLGFGAEFALDSAKSTPRFSSFQRKCPYLPSDEASKTPVIQG
jgi:hypothetical protein